MRFTSAAVVLAAATAVSATYGYSNDTISYTTEVVDVYTTVCPAGATITYGGHTYTNTETVVRLERSQHCRKRVEGV